MPIPDTLARKITADFWAEKSMGAEKNFVTLWSITHNILDGWLVLWGTWQALKRHNMVRGWDTRGPFYQHGLTLIPAWISNHIHYKVWDEITYPFLNFNGASIEV